MNAELFKKIDPQGIYTGSQAMALIDIPKTTFYRYVREEKIPKHQRVIDGRTVFLGHELLKVFTETCEILPKVFFVKPRRGRQKKLVNP